MKKLVELFSKQLEEALEIGRQYKFKNKAKDFSNVVISGLGGSGIGASIVQNYVNNTIKVPLVVNKDYTLPAFVDKHSLVIICSYSGNTEETLEAFQQAIQQKANIICVTSGGKIADMAHEGGYDCILVPGGMPPRACLGYSLVQLLYILNQFKLIGNQFEQEITASIDLLNKTEGAVRKTSKSAAKKILGKLPIVYAGATYEGVAVRFRQQLNENSKMLSWQGAIPEMNHNELVGWRDDAQDKAVILLRSADDYSRVQTRMEINKKIFKKYKPTIIELHSEGNSYWERAFYLIHLTDWISVELAELRNVDATEVNVIDFLKGSLAKA